MLGGSRGQLPQEASVERAELWRHVEELKAETCWPKENLEAGSIGLGHGRRGRSWWGVDAVAADILRT